MTSGIMITGSSGAGKTTLGQLVARELGFTFVDVDEYIWRRDTEIPFTAMYPKAEKISLLMDAIITGTFSKRFKKEGRFAWLSKNPMNVSAYETDPLCGFGFTLNGYRALLKLMEVAYDEKLSLRRNLPVHFMSGEDDPCAPDKKGFDAAVARLKADGYEVASYTGYTFEHLRDAGTDAQKRLLSLLDVLVDGPFVLAERSLDLSFRGSRNQRLIDVPKSLVSGDVVPAPPRWQGEY